MQLVANSADAVARRDAVVARQRSADRSGAPREGGVVGVEIEAGQQRRRTRTQPRGRRQPFGNVHRLGPALRRAYFAGSSTET